jgi:hypothetical protein
MIKLKDNKGQTLYYFLIFVLILVISWAMMLNVAKLIRDRMIMQNVADNIALSAAMHKARAMNVVGGLNYLIGNALASGTKPEFVQFPTYTTNAVAAFAWGDNESGDGVRELDEDVARLKSVVDKLKSAQDLVLRSHLVYLDKLAAQYNVSSSSPYNLAILPLMLSPSGILPTKENAQKYFGIKRNSKGIKYLKTVNIDANILPHTVANPFPLADIIKFAREELGEIVNDEVVEYIENALGMTEDMFEEKVYDTDSESWYVAADNFSDQKIAVVLRKKNSSSNAPLFASWLRIQYPQMFAYSASSIYNAKGTMFPTEESDLIGPSDLNIVSYASLLIQAGIYIAKVGIKDKTPYKILTIGITAYLAIRTFYMISQINEGKEQSPITRYNDAKMGGWGAHLVPYKTKEENND